MILGGNDVGEMRTMGLYEKSSDYFPLFSQISFI